MDRQVGGWLNLPGSGRTSSFVHGSEHNKKVDTGDGKHSHPPNTGTFTNKNCPHCKGK